MKKNIVKTVITLVTVAGVVVLGKVVYNRYKAGKDAQAAGEVEDLEEDLTPEPDPQNQQPAQEPEPEPVVEKVTISNKSNTGKKNGKK